MIGTHILIPMIDVHEVLSEALKSTFEVKIAVPKRFYSKCKFSIPHPLKQKTKIDNHLKKTKTIHTIQINYSKYRWISQYCFKITQNYSTGHTLKRKNQTEKNAR